MPSPAFAALLTQPPRRLVPIAAHATMLDLAARGILELDEQAGTVRAAADQPEGLEAFEQLVFDTVAARAPAGVAPAPITAIDLGSDKQAEEWSARFASLLGEAGQARGLVRPRVPAGARIVVWLVYTVAWVGGTVWVWQAGYPEWIMAVVLGAALVALPLRGMKHLVPHGDGRKLAAEYRRSRPGPAFGSPFTAAKGTFAWSRRDGVWRKLPIVSGRGLGWSPGAALAALPGGLVFLIPWAFILGSLTLPLPLLALGWLLWLPALLAFLRLAYRGLFDLTHPARVLTGPVVHIESSTSEDSASYCIAIDDGSGVAMRHGISLELHQQVHKDMWLRLEVTPKLNYLRQATIVS